MKYQFSKVRLKSLINIMKRVETRGGEINMDAWQGYGDIAKTESKAISCGTACCVAGWLAVSPEFKRVGGYANEYGGCPRLKGLNGIDAVGAFLKAEQDGLGSLVSGFDEIGERLQDENEFYGCDLDNITPTIVVNRLEQLLATGE